MYEFGTYKSDNVWLKNVKDYQQYLQSVWFKGRQTSGQTVFKMFPSATTAATKLLWSSTLLVGNGLVYGYCLQWYESWAIEFPLAQGQTYLKNWHFLGHIGTGLEISNLFKNVHILVSILQNYSKITFSEKFGQAHSHFLLPTIICQ